MQPAKHREAQHTPKYHRLAEYLAAQEARTILTFGEIERIIGAPLPLDAYERRQWWLVKGRTHTRPWLAAGRRTEAVDVLGRVVTFIKSAP